jgi:hypothetical protein
MKFVFLFLTVLTAAFGCYSTTDSGAGGDSGTGANDGGAGSDAGGRNARDGGPADTGASCQDDCTPKSSRVCDQGGENGYIVCGEWDNDGCLEWGPVNHCESYQTCDTGVCGPVCTDECGPAGLIRCAVPAQDAIEICSNYDADPCLEWGGLTSCGGQACVNGSCGQGCVNTCDRQGKMICDGDSFRTCGDANGDSCLEWSGKTKCDQGCKDGECVQCLPKDEPCENYDDCCECLHCCPVLKICVPDFWDSDCL